ncbi:MAG: hypothetical protein IRZ03_15025 [Acidobacterium ailaaui]|nr:hypothetical protein [Pseudacidobacterium ailaaui]
MANKRLKIEGDGHSKLVQLIREIGYNRDIDVKFATITSVSPFRVRLDGDNFDMEPEELILTERLAESQKYVNDRVVMLVVDDKLHIVLDKVVYA